MTDWKAVAMALVRFEGRMWTDLAELAFDRKTSWNRVPWVLGERLEAEQQKLLDDWRAGGVTLPMTLYGTVAETGASLWAAALIASPARTLRFTGALCLIGTLYGTASVLTRRGQAGPMNQTGPSQLHTEPATMPEQTTGPYRSAGW